MYASLFIIRDMNTLTHEKRKKIESPDISMKFQAQINVLYVCVCVCVRYVLRVRI